MSTKLSIFNPLSIGSTLFARLLGINTENKRRAIAGIYPIPDGTIDQFDRRQITDIYPLSEITGDPEGFSKQALLLAKHLPDGRAWNKKFSPTSNIGKLVRALSIEFYRVQILVKSLFYEMDILQTDELLEEWEESLTIPNDYFSINESEGVRRLQILALFAKFRGVQTAEDFEFVASVFGYNVDVVPASSITTGFAYTFPVNFFGNAVALAHTIVVIIEDDTETASFNYEFPILFSNTARNFLQTLFDSLAPANVKVLIINRGDFGT